MTHTLERVSPAEYRSTVAQLISTGLGTRRRGTTTTDGFRTVRESVTLSGRCLAWSVEAHPYGRYFLARDEIGRVQIAQEIAR